MEVVGLGLIAACMFVGLSVGGLLARAIGVSGDVGGVGFAMLLLVLVTNYVKLDERVKSGIQFISNLYIPIIVAMAAIQNVVSALKGGAVAFLAGGIATIASLALVPLLSRVGKSSSKSGGASV